MTRDLVRSRRQIDRLCDQFETAWLAGGPPRIIDFLEQVPAALRAQLLDELIPLDREYRCRLGENPASADYSVLNQQVACNADSAISCSSLLGSRLACSGLPSPSFLPQTLGDYDLLERVGAGAMGIVYRAKRTGSDRIVALKVLRPDRLADLASDRRHELLERFRRETQTMARVVHPNVVTVFDVGEADGHLFYSMQFVAGKDLAEAVKETPFVGKRAAAIVAKVASGLHAVHQAGVIHRDVKPRNIMIDSNDEPYLTDFGLARGGESTLTLTRSGDWLGTPCYTAPEQASEPSSASPRSDVYSLGATLYHVITGKPPFHSTDLWITMQWIAKGVPVPPRQLNPSIDRALEFMCLKCLEKDPQRRYASASALADELQQYLRGKRLKWILQGSMRRVGRTIRRRSWAATLLLCGLVGGALSLLLPTTSAPRLGPDGTEPRSLELSAPGQAICRMIDRGNALCTSGEVGPGLLALTAALEVAQAHAPDLEHGIRVSIGAWKDCLHQHRFISPGYPEGRKLVISPSGGHFLADGSANSVAVFQTMTGRPVSPWLHHPKPVAHAAISWDGSVVCTLTGDGVARLWRISHETADCRPLHSSEPTRALALTPNGSSILTGGASGNTRLWNAQQNIPHDLAWSHDAPVIDVKFSPDGDTALAVDADGRVCLWDVTSGTPVGGRWMNSGGVITAAFSPDGKLIATSCNDHNARIWERRSGTLLRTLPHNEAVSTAAFGSNSRTLVTACADRVARLWSLSDGRLLASTAVHGGRIESVNFSPDDSILATAATDGQARFFSAATGSPWVPPLFHHGPINAAVILGDGRSVLTSEVGVGARLWELGMPLRQQSTLRHRKAVYAAGFLAGGRSVVTASYSGAVQRWDTLSSKRMGTSTDLDSPVLGVTVCPDERYFATRSFRGLPRLWDATTGRLLCVLPHSGSIAGIQFSPDGRRVVTAGEDGTARLWEVPTGEPVGMPMTHPRGVNLVGFNSDGTRIVTACADGFLRTWDSKSLQQSGPPLEHGGWITALAFCRLGNQLISAGKDSTVRVWNTTMEHQSLPPLKHSGPINALAVAPDGSFLLTASQDCTVQRWNMRSGARMGMPWPHGGNVLCVAINSRADLAATGCADGTVRFWDVGTGTMIGPQLPCSGIINVLQFSPDGSLLLAAGSSNEAKLWKVPGACPTAPRELRSEVEHARGMNHGEAGDSQLAPVLASHKSPD